MVGCTVWTSVLRKINVRGKWLEGIHTGLASKKERNMSSSIQTILPYSSSRSIYSEDVGNLNQSIYDSLFSAYFLQVNILFLCWDLGFLQKQKTAYFVFPALYTLSIIYILLTLTHWPHSVIFQCVVHVMCLKATLT